MTSWISSHTWAPLRGEKWIVNEGTLFGVCYLLHSLSGCLTPVLVLEGELFMLFRPLRDIHKEKHWRYLPICCSLVLQLNNKWQDETLDLKWDAGFSEQKRHKHSFLIAFVMKYRNYLLSNKYMSCPSKMPDVMWSTHAQKRCLILPLTYSYTTCMNHVLTTRIHFWSF